MTRLLLQSAARYPWVCLATAGLVLRTATCEKSDLSGAKRVSKTLWRSIEMGKMGSGDQIKAESGM